MNETIGPQPWMTAPASLAVRDALTAAGGRDCVRYVGGCVRNAVMGLPADDIDLATTLTPDAVVKALAAADLRSIPTGIDHGTVTAIAGGSSFEITTLRRDVSTDGRRAVVAFTDDWAEDAQRRDFRLNALYADADGVLLDPTGQGLADARAGRIVFVGDPEQRIREDYLRIVRFFRFWAWYGRGEPDAAALAACAALTGLLAKQSGERTARELIKLLGAPDPRDAVRLMARTGVLAALLPASAGTSRLDPLLTISVDTDPELRLAALLPRDAQAVAKAADRLRLSKKQKARLVAAAAEAPPVGPGMTARDVRRLVYRLGRGAFQDRLKLAWASLGPSATAQPWLAMLAQSEAWERPTLAVTGEDAIAAGAPAGPAVGRALREVENWWIDHDFPPGRDQALARLHLAVAALAG